MTMRLGLIVTLAVVVAISSAEGYVEGRDRVDMPGMSLAELGVSRADFELATAWKNRPNFGKIEEEQNEPNFDDWNYSRSLAAQILALGSERWVSACLALTLSQPNPRLDSDYIRTRYNDVGPIVDQLNRRLAKHTLRFFKTAPYNHAPSGSFWSICRLDRTGTDDDRALLAEIESVLVRRLEDAARQMDDGKEHRLAQISWADTLKAFRDIVTRYRDTPNSVFEPGYYRDSKFMDRYSMWANSYWIIGQGVAFDLKPEEVSRLKEEGRLYGPDAASAPAAVDDRNWIVVSSLIIAAVLVGLLLGRQRLRRKFEQ